MSLLNAFRMRRLLVAGLSFYGGACAFKSPPPPPSGNKVASVESPPAPINAAMEAELPLRARVEAGADPNAYRVRLSGALFASASGPLVVQRSREGGLDLEHFVVVPEHGEWTDFAVQAGERYQYSVGLQQGDLAPGAQASLVVAVPRDLVIRRNTPEAGVGKLRGYQRIFVEDGVRIGLEDRSLDWQADEFIFQGQGAEIVSFPPGSVASAAAGRGRSAGLIRLQARRATGTLRVVGFGEGGGTGATGIVGAAGGPGAPGREAELATDNSNTYSIIRHALCARPPSNGQDGASGAVGSRGGPGGDGGDSARLEVRVRERTEWKLDFQIEGGAAGAGGQGGPGGTGGLGGAPGADGFIPGFKAAYPEAGCPLAQAGQQGPIGPTGPVGRLGTPGRRLAPQTDL
jgi:hypothetical protein